VPIHSTAADKTSTHSTGINRRHRRPADCESDHARTYAYACVCERAGFGQGLGRVISSSFLDEQQLFSSSQD
jgi:hypothetical protein